MVRRRAGRPGEQGFSLLEMLAAMAVLLVLMLVLFRLFGSVQSAWSLTMNTTELYENGRIALEVITTDLQSAIARADDLPGQHIRFHQDSPSALWFVTMGEPSSAASAPLIEVAYRWQDNTFQRAFVDDSCAAWNVYGPRDDADDQDGYVQVVSGVVGQVFTCYDASMNAYVPDTADEETALPDVVSVALTLMDSKAFALWQELPAERRPDYERKVCRTFRKTLYLGGKD